MAGKRLTQEEFLKRAKAVHGNRYDYSESVYVNRRTDMKFICPNHGGFYQNAQSHLRGHICKLCFYDNLRMNTIDFITKAHLVHGDTYDYSDTNYISAFDKVIITCKVHGNYAQVANDHLSGSGCRECNASGGFDTSKVGSLYIQSVFDDYHNLVCYKVGISSDPHRRLQQINLKSNYNHELLWYFSGTGKFIKDLETRIHRECKRYDINKSLVQDGYTELVEVSEIDKVFSIIRKALLNH